MLDKELKALLEGLTRGEVELQEAVTALARSPVEELGFATLDTHRELRQNLPEVIFAASKTADQVVEIAARLLETTSGAVMATRCPPETAAALLMRWPDAVAEQLSGLVVLRESPVPLVTGSVAVVAAGTSDLPVAEEAAGVLSAVGAEVGRFTDVGVAGVHRVLAVQDDLRGSDVVIVVAGMDGALPSVVGGMVGAPVVAVPTSVGYGASFSGLAALLTMLNSCAAGVTVCNIDNGFGAAMAALRILRPRS